MNRLVASVWIGAALLIAGFGLSILFGPKGDWTGWLMGFAFLAAAGLATRRAWQEWTAPAPGEAGPRFAMPEPSVHGPDAPGAWTGPPIPLERQIEELASAGLQMSPGRTLDELLISWPRADYEADPYGLLLFMFGIEVESEPLGRWFTACGWDFDAECLVGRGDYVHVMTGIIRITGRPDLFSGLSDDFDMDKPSCTLRYAAGGVSRELTAKVDNDWADPDTMAAFARDVEDAVGDGRRFWAADNGQASTLFFISAETADRINALRPGVIERYGASD